MPPPFFLEKLLNYMLTDHYGDQSVATRFRANPKHRLNGQLPIAGSTRAKENMSLHQPVLVSKIPERQGTRTPI